MVEIHKKNSICLITCSDSEAFIQPLSNMEKILCSFSKLYVIIGCPGNIFDAITPVEAKVFKIKYKTSSNLFLRILWYFLLEIKISFALAKISSHVSSVIFFMEGDAILPVLVSRILGITTIRVLPSAISLKMAELHKGFFAILIAYVNKMAYSFSDKIVLYSPNLIYEWNLEEYSSKILIANRHFLDFSHFKLSVKFSQRNDFIGYIGRFSEEKGIMNFVKSIPLIVEQRLQLNILLIGDGYLKSSIEKYIYENGLKNKVNLIGWVSHEDLPKYLNSLKLLVIPSYTEGLPNIMLEAMACGTPVLATRVGAIPDIIKDEETGFIMRNNSSECIAKNVFRALEHPDVENIVMNSKEFVENNFTYNKAVERYSAIFKNLKN